MALELVGRDGELAVLDAALARSRAQATLIVIEGEAGYGKTALVEALAERAVAAGAVLHLAAADPFETDRPFGPVLDALGLWQQVTIADDVAGTSGPGPFGLAADARYRLVDIVCTHVETLAAADPTAIVVEDLHYCDASAVLVLRSLRKRLAAYPVLLVASTRPVAADRETQRLVEQLREDADHLLHLGPLDEQSTLRLTERTLGATTIGPRLRRRIAHAEGSPLLLFDLLEDLDQGGGLERDEQGVELAESARMMLGVNLTASTARRVARLSGGAPRLLNAATVLGASFDVRLALELADIRPSDSDRMVRELLAAGFFSAAASSYRFRHDLVREAVDATIPRAERAHLHRGAAAALARMAAAPAVVAAHLEASGSADIDELRGWLIRAAEEALVRSPATAHRLYGRALDVTDRGDPQWATISVARLGAAAFAGMCDEAEREGAELLDVELDRLLALRVRWWLAGVLFLRNRAADAARLYEEAAESLPDGADAARCIAMAALSRVVAFDPQLRPACDRAVSVADVVGDPVARTVAYTAASRAVGFNGEWESARSLSGAAIPVADSDPSRESHRYQPLFVHALAMLDLGHLDEVLTVADRGRRLAADTGCSWAEPLYDGLAAVTQLFAGRLDDALTSAAAGLAVADDSGVRLTALWCLSVQALVHQLHGEDGLAQASIEAGRRELSTYSGQVGFDLLELAEARALLNNGDGRAALTRLRGVLDLALAIGVPTTAFCVLADLVALGVRLGDRETLKEVASFVDEHRRGAAVPALVAEIAAVTSVALDGGDLSTVFLEQQPIDGARIDLAAAAAAMEQGNTTLAERLARRGERVLIERGAVGELRRARAMLPGIDRRGRPPRRVTHGWGSLTPTERYVVERIAKGASNRAVAQESGMSPRTVETHVSRILHKLGASSRLVVAAMFRESEADRRA